MPKKVHFVIIPGDIANEEPAEEAILVADQCESLRPCWGKVMWLALDDDPAVGVLGSCEYCGLEHINCPNCGPFPVGGLESEITCPYNCGARWEMSFREGLRLLDMGDNHGNRLTGGGQPT